MVYLINYPYTFEKVGEVEKYAQHICYWVECVYTNVVRNNPSERWRKIAWLLVKSSNFLQLYFSSINMKEVCSQRALITEFVLENRGIEGAREVGEVGEVGGVEEEWSEKLLTIKGSGIGFSYPPNTSTKSQVKISRSNLGIAKKQLVFINGANSFKIIPELREAWAKIISRVPNSVLLLYPFNPNWSASYPEGYLKEQLYRVFAQYNIDKNPLIFLPPVPNSTDVTEYLQLGDIYLDSFPYGGATSVVSIENEFAVCSL